MVTNEGWPANHGSDFNLAVTERVTVPLTYRSNVAYEGGVVTVSTVSGAFQSNDDWVHQATRGFVDFTWGWDRETSGEIAIDLRLIVAPQDQDGTVDLQAFYNLNTSVDANEAFLWSDSIWLRTNGTYIEPESSAPSNVRVPVMCKAKRRVEANECICLVMQYEEFVFQTDHPVVAFRPRLRVLGSKRT